MIPTRRATTGSTSQPPQPIKSRYLALVPIILIALFLIPMALLRD